MQTCTRICWARQCKDKVSLANAVRVAGAFVISVALICAVAWCVYGSRTAKEYKIQQVAEESISGFPLIPTLVVPVPSPPPGLIGLPAPSLGEVGVIAGINVVGYVRVGLASINRSATTTTFPEINSDESLDASTMRVVSTSPFVLVQKSDGVHVEYVNESGIVSPSDSIAIAGTLPQLRPGGVVFTDVYNNKRVYGLGDGGRIRGLPASGALAFAKNSTRYMVGADAVYFLTYHASIRQSGSDFTVVRVYGADPKTFSVLYPDANFARDDFHYFINGEAVAGITPQSAPPLVMSSNPAAFASVVADSEWLYRVSIVTDPSEAATSVHYLDSGKITKQLLNSVYYRSIYDVDTEAGRHTEYAFKQDEVWYGSTKVAGADPETFELVVGLSDYYTVRGHVSYEYARDAKRVYYMGVEIPGADRATFLPIGSNTAYGADHEHVFLTGIEIPYADPTTFAPLWHPLYEGCSLSEYAKDATRVFYKNQEVIGADAQTFESLLGEYGRDAKGVYFRGVFHPEIDAESFVAPGCGYG